MTMDDNNTNMSQPYPSSPISKTDLNTRDSPGITPLNQVNSFLTIESSLQQNSPQELQQQQQTPQQLHQSHSQHKQHQELQQLHQRHQHPLLQQQQQQQPQQYLLLLLQQQHYAFQHQPDSQSLQINGYYPYFPGSYGQAYQLYLMTNGVASAPYLYPQPSISNAYNTVRTPIPERGVQQQEQQQQPTLDSNRANALDGSSEVSLKRTLDDQDDQIRNGGEGNNIHREDSSPDDYEKANKDSAEYNAQVKKTRKRLSVSCRTCRQKKIKCDRQRPICGSCSKNNLPTHLCIYDDSPWVSSLVQEQNLYSEIENLKDQNKRLLLIVEKEELRSSSISRYYASEILKLDGKRSLTSQPNEQPVISDSIDESINISSKLKKVKIELTNLSLTVKSLKSTKTFGPLSWQNIHLQETFCKSLLVIFGPHAERYKDEHKEELRKNRALTTYLFESKSLFPFRSVDGRKLDPNLEPSKNDLIGKKLQEILSMLPSYKYLERKMRCYFDMQYSKLFDPFFDDQIVINDFKRIFKKTRKGGVDINAYDPSRNHTIELAKLSQLFLMIKFGIVVDENNKEFDDSQNVLVPGGVFCIFVSNCFVKPSIAAINALLFTAVLKILNPDDWGDDILPEKSPFDISIILDMAYNLMMSLGFWKSYEEIDDIFKNPNDPNENYISELHLKGLWKNLLYIDSITAGQTGNSLALRGFTRYKSLSTGDLCIRQTIFTRYYYGKYSYLNGFNQGSIGKVFGNIFDYSQQQGKLTRLDVEQDLYDIIDYFQNWLKMGPTFWKEYYHRTSKTSPVKDRRLIFTLGLLDLSSSLSYLLYFSYLNPSHDFNGSNPVLDEDERRQLDNLKDQFLNNTLLHSIYLLKIVDWCITQELTNEAVSKNKLLLITSRPRFKKSIMKALSIVLVIISERGKLDEYGVYMDVSSANPDFESVSLFSLQLHELEELCFNTNVNNQKSHCYYNNDFINQFCSILEELYLKIRVNDLFMQDIRWFSLFKEYFYLLLYFMRNKRLYLNDGKRGEEDYTARKIEILNVEQYFEIKDDFENKYDNQKDFKAVAVGSILK